MRRCRAGVTTQQRLRSPPPGMLGPRPSLLMIAVKRPSPRRLHAWPLSNPTCLRAKASEGNHCACRAAGKKSSYAIEDVVTWQLATRDGSAHPRAKPATHGAPPWAFPLLGKTPSPLSPARREEAPLLSPRRGERGEVCHSDHARGRENHKHQHVIT